MPLSVPYAPSQIYVPNGRLVDLLRAQGQDAARAAELRGQQQAALWGGAGQAIQGTVGSVLQAQQQAPIDALNKLKAADAAHLAAGKSSLAGVMAAGTASPQGPDLAGDTNTAQPDSAAGFLKKEGDVSVWDIPKLTSYLASKGFGDNAETLLTGAQQMNTAHRQEAQAKQAFQQAQTNTVAKGAGVLYGLFKNMTTEQIASAGPQTFDLIASQFMANNTPPQQLAQIKSRLFANPSQTLQMLDGLSRGSSEKATPLAEGAILPNQANPSGPPLAVNPKPVEPGKGDYTINGQRFDATGHPIGAVQPKEAPVAGPTKPGTEEAFFEQFARERGIDPLKMTVAQQAEARKKWAASGKAPDPDEAPVLTPEAIKLTARQFAMTGTLPPMGMGKAGALVRTKIINEAAKEYAGLDLPSQIAAFKANQSSLVQVTDTLNKVQAFEGAAGKNLDQFLALADKIPDTGVPWLNAPLRSINAKGLGSAEQAAANAARDVALREIARVTSDPKLSGVLSDSARQEVSSLSPASATFAQIKAVAKTLRQDMANVESSLTAQQQGIQRLIASPPAGIGSTVPATVAPVPSTQKNPFR